MLEDSHNHNIKFTYSKECRSCGLKFDTANQLLNHQNRFCLNSGYDSLNGLLQKQIEKKNNFGLTQKNNNTKKNGLKKYGQYSLSKLKYQNDVSNSLIRDMTNIHQHRKEIEILRPYDFDPNKQKSHVSKRAYSTKNFLQDETYQNSASKSRFGLKNQLESYLNPNLNMNKNEINSISPPTRNIIDRKIISVLNRSDASILNMDPDQKKLYANTKKKELKQIQELYVKNGGQSKQFKESVQKMIKFYQAIIDQKPIQSQLSIASRPQTPIQKLTSLNHQKSSQVLINSQNNNKSSRLKNNMNQPQSARIQSQFQNHQSYPFLNNGQKQNHYIPNHNYSNNASSPQIIMMPSPVNHQQDYATMYYLKMMEDMMKVKAQENSKLSQILATQIKNNNQAKSQNKEKSPNMNQKQNNFRFQEQIDVEMPTQDRMIKLLQNQELDELKMLSKLPLPLQDIKLQSMEKAAQTRFEMEKQVLKQKLQRLKWQEQIQHFQQKRKFQNDDWTDKQRKKLLKKQMGQYVDDYRQEFTQHR